jgi:outer membrane translocation and assembly module TamA
MNGELRFPLLTSINLGGAAFVDVGNVFARVNEVDLRELRTGVGFGLRWKSPVGPLRIDLGWKTSRRTFANGEREPRFSYHFSIGQAF